MKDKKSSKKEAWRRLGAITFSFLLVLLIANLAPGVIAQSTDDDTDMDNEADDFFCCFGFFMVLWGVMAAISLAIPILVLLIFVGGTVVAIILIIKIINKDREKKE